MYEKLKIKKKKSKFVKNIKPGTVVHSNDKYFQGADGYSKNREAVVLKSNKKGHVALSKLTTSKEQNYEDVKNYPGSRYNPETIYSRTQNNKKIKVSKSRVSNDNNKFILSNFPSIPIESVEDIVYQSINNKRFGKRNKKRLLSIINDNDSDLK